VRKPKQSCASCGKAIRPERSNHCYEESGLPNIVLQGVEVRSCVHCDHHEIVIPQVIKVHRAIAAGLLKSPYRLTGPQVRFLRRHLELSGEQLAAFLHTDKTKISKWERGSDPIGPVSDRLMRLVVAALDKDLAAHSPAVARGLPNISDEPGTNVVMHVDLVAFTAAYSRVLAA
jgi:putative zinc finger/helix-turn-helix YgiT family protein